MSKNILGIRGGSTNIMTYHNGDRTDMKLVVCNGTDLLFNTNHASSFPSKLIEGKNLYDIGPHQGGILKPSIYNYLCGDWGAPLGKSLRLSVPRRGDLIVPSIRPNNAYHQGLLICEDVRIHAAMADLSGNGSASCMTIWPTEWKSFIDLFEIGETGTFTLSIPDGYTYPV
jgi:hypothetical protein